LPYERYAFLIDVDGDVIDDGLEHRNSTYCLVPRFAFTTKPGANRMFGLFCHEFFHLWNVKRMSPSSLVEIDYGRESYTNSLWISEGITTYYEHILLRRARIYTVPEFLDSIADLIDRYLSTPGRHLQSAEESSYDAWIKFNRPSENSVNTEISYYTVGALLGMAIDLQIRRNTGSKRNLDDVMRTVYRETYGKGHGFTDEEFQTTCEKIAGKNLDDFFENHVRGTNEIPLDRYLGFAGLRLVPKSDGGNHGFAGIKLVQKTEVPIIDSVLSSTPAVEGELFPGDEVIGVDGNRVDKRTLRFQVENSRPGKTLLFTVSRSGRLREIAVKLGRRPACQYRLQKKPMANDEQKLLFKNWLLEDWGNRIEYEDRAISPAVDWLFFKPDYF
jgi:predicted metalloprotease with PDZ domain